MRRTHKYSYERFVTVPAPEGIVRILSFAVGAIPQNRIEDRSCRVVAIVSSGLLSLAGGAFDEFSFVIAIAHLLVAYAGLR